jgi:hypothetical protein
MAEPPRRGLQAARRGGLTSPDPVRTLTAANGHPTPDLLPTRPRNPGQAAEQASGRTLTARFTQENSSCRNRAGNDLPESAGGSRLRIWALSRTHICGTQAPGREFREQDRVVFRQPLGLMTHGVGSLSTGVS